MNLLDIRIFVRGADVPVSLRHGLEIELLVEKVGVAVRGARAPIPAGQTNKQTQEEGK